MDEQANNWINQIWLKRRSC